MLTEWHDFFVVLGAAAGTLIGAMFVVVSIASGMVKESEPASRIFVTPTIAHLSFVLMSCAFTLVPSLSRSALGATAGVAGIVLLGYAGRNMFHIRRRREVVWSDHLWYSFCPVLAYLLIIVGAILMLEAAPDAVEILALALALLVISGIRNAWDLILFFLERRGREGDRPAA